MKCMRVFLISILALAMGAEATTNGPEGLRRSATAPVRRALGRSPTLTPEALAAFEAARRDAREALVRAWNAGLKANAGDSQATTLSGSSTVRYSPAPVTPPASPAPAGAGFSIIPQNPGGSHSQGQ